MGDRVGESRGLISPRRFNDSSIESVEGGMSIVSVSDATLDESKHVWRRGSEITCYLGSLEHPSEPCCSFFRRRWEPEKKPR